MRTVEKSKTSKAVSFKAFTLVELIVVMVILAILVALMVPSLSKYIDKASDQGILVEARYCLTALQSYATETYAKDKLSGNNLQSNIATDLGRGKASSEIYQRAECPGTINSVIIDGTKIKSFVYVEKNGKKKVTWTNTGGFGDVTNV